MPDESVVFAVCTQSGVIRFCERQMRGLFLLGATAMVGADLEAWKKRVLAAGEAVALSAVRVVPGFRLARADVVRLRLIERFTIGLALDEPEPARTQYPNPRSIQTAIAVLTAMEPGMVSSPSELAEHPFCAQYAPWEIRFALIHLDLWPGLMERVVDDRWKREGE